MERPEDRPLNAESMDTAAEPDTILEAASRLPEDQRQNFINDIVNLFYAPSKEVQERPSIKIGLQRVADGEMERERRWP